MRAITDEQEIKGAVRDAVTVVQAWALRGITSEALHGRAPGDFGPSLPSRREQEIQQGSAMRSCAINASAQFRIRQMQKHSS